jgi:hypothetical protein
VSERKTPFLIREASLEDIPVLARHRAAMFRDMGSIRPELEDPLTSATTELSAQGRQSHGSSALHRIACPMPSRLPSLSLNQAPYSPVPLLG